VVAIYAQEIVASVPLQELVSVKCVEQRGDNILEVKRTSVSGQNTTLQLLTNEVSFSLLTFSVLCSPDGFHLFSILLFVTPSLCH